MPYRKWDMLTRKTAHEGQIVVKESKINQMQCYLKIGDEQSLISKATFKAEVRKSVVPHFQGTSNLPQI